MFHFSLVLCTIFLLILEICRDHLIMTMTQLMKLFKHINSEKSSSMTSYDLNCHIDSWLFMKMFLLVQDLSVFFCTCRSFFYIDLMLINRSTLSLLRYTLMINSVNYTVLISVNMFILWNTVWDKLLWSCMLHETLSLLLLFITASTFAVIEL